MGRAFPELQMCLPSLSGVSATPMAMADEKGNSVVISTISNRWTERIARSVTIDMGCSAMIALYAMTGAQLKQMTVPRTLLLAEDIGRVARETRSGARRRRGGSAGADRWPSGSSKGRSSTSHAEPTPDSRRPRPSSREPATARVPHARARRSRTSTSSPGVDGEIAASVPDLIIDAGLRDRRARSRPRKCATGFASR